MRDNFYTLPPNLPVPQDDGACSHLEGTFVPNLSLPSTSGYHRNLFGICRSQTVLFFYPRTGRPDEQAPVGWDEIPGARGCTPHSCGYRDLHDEFRKVGAQVFGISTQTTEFQKELVERIRLPYEILSDHRFTLTNQLRLPTFTFNSMRLLKRMAWIVQDGRITKVFYPVFPPDKNAETVLNFIKEQIKVSPERPTIECPILETLRLSLEPVYETHFQELWNLFKDPELHKFTPFEPLTLEKHIDRFRRWSKRYSPDGSEIWLNWVGREKEQGKAVAHFQVGIRDKIATIGYLVASEFHRKGLATEGLNAVLKYLRNGFAVREVKAWSDTRNKASHELAKKLGMAQVGLIKDADFFKGSSSDEYEFSMTLRY